MVLPIPDFDPPKTSPETKEAWQEICCELVTPMHGGGVRERESDDQFAGNCVFGGDCWLNKNGI